MIQERAEPSTLSSRARQLAWLAWRQLRVSVLLAIGIALLLTAAMPSSMSVGRLFAMNLLYAQCIGLSIQLLIEGGRHGVSAMLRTRRPDDPDLKAGWPGWRWFGPWLVISSIAGYLIGGSLADAMLDARHIASVLGGNLRPLVFLAVLTLMASVLTSIGFIARAEAQAARARAELLEREAAEYQLKLLESQLEPHMLFNTLANLRVLIALDPARAQAMLDRLIAYLRGTLGGSLARTHPLSAEFARLDDYLALMAVRMGDRLQVSLDLPDDLGGVQVPPLLLQPLVENAIRHGLEPSVHGGRIAVAATAQADGRVMLTVHDTGVGLATTTLPGGLAGPDATPQALAQAVPGESHPARRDADDAGGFGTRHVRQRLAALYGPGASLSLELGPDGKGTLAKICLPRSPLPPAASDAAAAHRRPQPITGHP